MPEFKIAERTVGLDHPTYIVAEVSANHNQDFDQAVKIIEAAAEAGVDAVKLQTYTPDTITIDADNEHFQIKGTLWDGRNLYELYGEAYTPWEWQPKLQKVAENLGLHLFSTPFDFTSVDFLEEMKVPVYKVASFENVDLPLLRKIARTGKPIMMSTGMASLAEIDEAVRAIRETGNHQLALLKAVSAYPAPAHEMNLRTIPHLAEAFNVVAGLSDHTMGSAVPVAAVALGARIVEKHITLSRDLKGPDSEFSLEPHEFKTLVDSIRIAEQALGQVSYQTTEKEESSKVFRRSLFVVQDIQAGDVFTADNIRSIRPGYGLATKYYEQVIGTRASCDIARGTPLSWDHFTS
ncbi:pseudaminic acid synthase [Anaerolineales bacterium]